ncbi:Histidine N-acetyltransferase [Exaiptasia diaphana]|nr:Histidine N-acetyltransferase [Exaiptasia diaphana]
MKVMADSVVTVRVATDDDVDNILHVSEGIYNGEDYLPVVLQQWLNYERKLIYLAEYEGEVIGLQVATIAENEQSFVTQALRIHPKYRGRRLSYQINDAVLASVRNKFPQVTRNMIVCLKYSAAFVMFRNKHFKPIIELKIHSIRNIPSDVLAQMCPEFDYGLSILDKKNALEFYRNKKLSNLIGPHSVVMAGKSFPHKVPDDAHLVASKVEKLFVDVSLQEFLQGKFPKSFTQELLAPLSETTYLYKTNSKSERIIGKNSI